MSIFTEKKAANILTEFTCFKITTMKKVIETMPTMMGQQFYFAGMPLPADKVCVYGRSIEKIFLDTCDGDFCCDDDPDIKILNDYYRYYLLAPCWKLGDITEAQIMSANADELHEICNQLGIDPI